MKLRKRTKRALVKGVLDGIAMGIVLSILIPLYQE